MMVAAMVEPKKVIADHDGCIERQGLELEDVVGIQVRYNHRRDHHQKQGVDRRFGARLDP